MSMFVFHTIKKNIYKHWKKSFLSFFLSALIVLFLLLYMENIEGNKVQLINLSDTIPVTCGICNIDGSQEVGLQIDYERLQKILDTGLVKDEVITTQMYTDLINPYFERKTLNPGINFIGTNSLDAFTAFSAKDVTYIKNYNDSFLKGQEAVCIVRNTFLKDYQLNVGDEIKLSVFAELYKENAGNITFTYQNLGNVKLKIIGSYAPKQIGRSEELPDIIGPIGCSAGIYKGTGVRCYASSARFTVKEPFKINEFKSKMQELGFKSINIQAGFSRKGNTLLMNDETFIMAATQLTESLDLLKSLAPFIFIIVAVIGFISSYLLMQSRRYEFAIMRSLGTGRNRSFAIIFLENLILVLSGSLFGTVISASIVNVNFTTAGHILTAFLFSYMLGTAFALYLLNKFSVMAILSKTD